MIKVIQKKKQNNNDGIVWNILVKGSPKENKKKD